MTARQDGEVPVEPTLVGGEPVEGGPVEQWQDWLPEWLAAAGGLPGGWREARVRGEPVEGGPVEQWQDWLPEWLTAPVDLPAGFGTAGSVPDDAAPAPAPGAGVPGD